MGPDTREEAEQVGRRHAITFTVVRESKEGEPLRQVLWLADISAPSEAWSYAAAPIDELSRSFDVGSSEEQLEAEREAYRKELNAERPKGMPHPSMSHEA